MTLPINYNKRLLSVDDYQNMIAMGIFAKEERVELINGEIITISPIGPLHISVVNQLMAVLYPMFGNEFVISAQNPIHLSDDSQPEPDIAFYKKRKHRYRKQLARPHDIVLLIEVANTSLHYDQVVKVPLYAAAGIKNYLIVDVKNEWLEKYSQPHAGAYRSKEIFKIGEKVELLGQQIEVEHVLK